MVLKPPRYLAYLIIMGVITFIVWANFDQWVFPTAESAHHQVTKHDLTHYLLTACATLIVASILMVLGDFLAKIKCTYGAHGTVPVSSVLRIVISCLIIPYLEELVFRLAPSLYLPGPSAHWQVGLTISLFFAYVHNLQSDGEYLYFHVTSLPILQFCLGCYCWYLMREFGLWDAGLAHAIYNTVCEFYPSEAIEDQQD